MTLTFDGTRFGDDAAVALPVTNPWLHSGEYAVELSDADAERVGTTEPAAIDVGSPFGRPRSRRTSVATSARRL